MSYGSVQGNENTYVIASCWGLPLKEVPRLILWIAMKKVVEFWIEQVGTLKVYIISQNLVMPIFLNFSINYFDWFESILWKSILNRNRLKNRFWPFNRFWLIFQHIFSTYFHVTKCLKVSLRIIQNAQQFHLTGVIRLGTTKRVTDHN